MALYRGGSWGDATLAFAGGAAGGLIGGAVGSVGLKLLGQSAKFVAKGTSTIWSEMAGIQAVGMASRLSPRAFLPSGVGSGIGYWFTKPDVPPATKPNVPLKQLPTKWVGDDIFASATPPMPAGLKMPNQDHPNYPKDDRYKIPRALQFFYEGKRT